MVRIGIELNGVLRNVNYQMCKYYAKDIDPLFTFDKKDIDNLNMKDTLKFNSKKEFNEFVYVNYPYEIFGCANVMQRGLQAQLTNWLAKLPDFEKEKFDVGTYSLNEEALTIQSTYFFLSKFGSRVRTMYFPESTEELWEKFDVIITCDPDVIRSVPKGKRVIIIRRDNNKRYEKNAFACYDTMKELLEDTELLDKLCTEKQEKENFFKKLTKKLHL